MDALGGTGQVLPAPAEMVRRLVCQESSRYVLGQNPGNHLNGCYSGSLKAVPRRRRRLPSTLYNTLHFALHTLEFALETQ